MADDKPAINLNVKDVICRVHGEPFRHAWPSGYLMFSLHAATTAIEHNAEVAKYVGKDANRLDGVLAEFGPLCRLLTPEQRMEGYRLACESKHFGAKNMCRVCRKWALGQVCTVDDAGAGHQEHPRVLHMPVAPGVPDVSAFPHGYDDAEQEAEAWHDTGGDGYSWPDDDGPDAQELAEDAEEMERWRKARR